MPAYKLVYYAARGRAEMIRMAFAYGGIEFEDIRMPASALAAARDEGKLTPPFGQFPYLEVDGASIGQSATIMRFVCNRAGLMPSNEIEAAKADSVAEQMTDITNLVINIMWGGHSEEAKAQKIAEANTTKLPALLKGVIAYRQASSGPFIFGSQPTIADIAYFTLAEQFNVFLPGSELTTLAPELNSAFDGVKNHPKLAAYFAKRAEVEAAEKAARK